MLRRTFALLILTSLAACKEAAKTPRVASVAPHAKSVAKAEVPRPVQLPTLCDKLASTELPSIKIEAMKIGAAITLWREALIKVDQCFTQLGFFLPEDDATLSLELPAGKAETSLAALLKAYACDSRKGERHVNVQKEGSAFAEDGAWIEASSPVPAGFLDVMVQRGKSKQKPNKNEEMNHEIVCPGVVETGSSPGPLFVFIQSKNQLITVLQEKAHAEIEKIISDLTPKPMNTRIESVWLRSPRALSAEAGLDLSKLLSDPTMEVLSHQEIDGPSGQTMVLNTSLRPLARLAERRIVPVNSDESQASFSGQGYWADVLENSESDQWHDELTVIPSIQRDDKTIGIEIKQNLSWQSPEATRAGLKMGDENKLDSGSGDTRILLQEAEPDGRHWRVHLLRGSVIKCVPPATACLTRKFPVRDLKVQNADAALLEKLSHPAFAGGTGTLEKALNDWAVKEKIELKNLGVISPEIHFRSCGPLSASVLLSELMFRSPVEAVAKDGAVELRWPQKTKKYKVDSSAYVQAKEAGFPPDCKVVSEQFDGQAWIIEIEREGGGSFRELVESYQSLLPLSGHIHCDAFDLESRELQRLTADHPDEAELLKRLQAAKSAHKIRQVEGAMLFGNTSLFATSLSQQMPRDWHAPAPLDASGTFLAPQAAFYDPTSIGCLIECTAQMDPVWEMIDVSLKISDTALIGQQKVQVQAQLGNKPVQSFPVEVPILRQQSIETYLICRVGEVKLFARSTLPSDQAGQAATRERLFFVRIDATPQKPVIVELP